LRRYARAEFDLTICGFQGIATLKTAGVEPAVTSGR
jgi:hypothetical protein